MLAFHVVLKLTFYVGISCWSNINFAILDRLGDVKGKQCVVAVGVLMSYAKQMS